MIARHTLLRRHLARAYLLGVVTLMLSAHASANDQSKPGAQEHTMQIAVKFDDQTIIAELEDNATRRDLLAQLPLTLSFEDYHATEKIAYPPRKLSTSGAPDGYDPSMGTIAYYAPWGNIALFYRDFGYSKSLVNLGKIVSGLDALAQRRGFQAIIERAAD